MDKFNHANRHYQGAYTESEAQNLEHGVDECVIPVAVHQKSVHQQYHVEEEHKNPLMVRNAHANYHPGALQFEEVPVQQGYLNQYSRPQQPVPRQTVPEKKGLRAKAASYWNWITGTNPSKVDAVVDSFMAMYNRLSAEDQSCLIPKMMHLLGNECQSKLEARTRNDEQVRQLEFHNAQLENELRIAKRQSKGVHTVEEMQLLRDRANYLEKKVMKYEQEIQALRSDVDMERNHKITVATMSGVIQNTAERSVLKGVVTSYFDDSMHSFVNACKLTRDEVYSMENSIMKQLEAAFKKGSGALAQHIVHFCESQTADTDTTMAFRALSEHGRNPLQMVKQFLSAKVYARAPNQTLSEDDWSQRKAVILLKSVYLHAEEGRSFTTMMETIIRDKFDFLLEYGQSGRATESAVEKFLSATVTLLQQMLKSESPIIPWTGLKAYDPLFMEVDARQLACQTDDPMDGDCFKGWKIDCYRRPILLSCNHGQVTIDKGKVRLEVPKQDVMA